MNSRVQSDFAKLSYDTHENSRQPVVRTDWLSADNLIETSSSLIRRNSFRDILTAVVRGDTTSEGSGASLAGLPWQQ